jgi:hypothetical protein
LSAYGVPALKPWLARTVVAVTALCALGYTVHYFSLYPAVSVDAFENYGFKEALGEAVRRTQGRVLLGDEYGRSLYIDLLFFGSLSGTHVPMLIGTREDLRPGDVFIFFVPDRGMRGLYGVEVAPLGTALGKDPRTVESR